MARPKATELTERELEIMHVFWKQGALTAGEVREALATAGRDLAYTTVATLVRILMEKEFVRQTNDERPLPLRADPHLRRCVWPPFGRSGQAGLPRLARASARAADRGPQTDGEGAGPPRKNSAGAATMSSVTQILLWCPVQVSVLACTALGVGSLLGRRRPAAGATVAVAALLAVAGLTATAFCPWPAWHLGWEKLPWSHSADSHIQRAEPAGREAPVRSPSLASMTTLSTRSPAIRPKTRLSRPLRRRDSGAHWPIIGWDS